MRQSTFLFRKVLNFSNSLQYSRRAYNPKTKKGQREKRLYDLTQILKERKAFNGPVVAVVGRTNVGKTKIFSRLTKKGTAIVDMTPGVTRDRRFGQGKLADLDFQVIDTPGYEEVPKSLRTEIKEVKEGMVRQAELALTDADIALFVVDGRSGVTPADEHMAAWLKRRLRYDVDRDLQVLLVANKCELSVNCYGVIADCARLGFGEPICISAEETDGFADLWQALDESFQDIGRSIDPLEIEETENPQLRLCIAGRPNVGKSTLVNRLVDAYRCTTADSPGTTRDAIEVPLYDHHSGADFLLIDTAGLLACSRYKATMNAEKAKMTRPDALAMEECLKAVKRSNVVAVLIDVNDKVLEACDAHLMNPSLLNPSHRTLCRMLLESMLRETDHKIIQYALDEGKGVVLALNKWDRLPFEFQQEQVSMALEEILPEVTLHLGPLPVVYMSAINGENVQLLLERTLQVYERWNWRVNTGSLNNFLRQMQRLHPPPTKKGDRLLVRYGVQQSTRPPNITLFCGASGVIPDSYLNRIRNKMREEFDLSGVPLRFQMKESTHENPYADKVTGYGDKDAEILNRLGQSSLDNWTLKQGMLATDQRIHGGGWDFGGPKSKGNHYRLPNAVPPRIARQKAIKAKAKKQGKS